MCGFALYYNQLNAKFSGCDQMDRISQKVKPCCEAGLGGALQAVHAGGTPVSQLEGSVPRVCAFGPGKGMKLAKARR